MTPTHILDLLIALAVVAALVAVTRLAFVAAGVRPAAEQPAAEDERLAA